MHAIARRNDFKDFLIEVLTQADLGVVIKNYQVIHLSEASFGNASIQSARAGPCELLQAQNLLFNWPAFGIVEHYDKSLALFSEKYREFLSNRRLESRLLNFSRSSIEPVSSVESQLESIHNLLGPEVYSLLEGANEYDMELYNSCLVKFDHLCSEALGKGTSPKVTYGQSQ